MLRKRVREPERAADNVLLHRSARLRYRDLQRLPTGKYGCVTGCCGFFVRWVVISRSLVLHGRVEEVVVLEQQISQLVVHGGGVRLAGERIEEFPIPS